MSFNAIVRFGWHFGGFLLFTASFSFLIIYPEAQKASPPTQKRFHNLANRTKCSLFSREMFGIQLQILTFAAQTLLFNQVKF